MNRLTLNINCRAMPEEGYARILRGTSTWVYLLDPTHVHIDSALDAGKKVVVRTYAHDEVTFHLRYTPGQVVEFLNANFAKYRGREVYFIIGVNEPKAPGDDYFPRLSNWLVTWGRLANAAGYGVVLGGFNTSKSIRVGSDGNWLDPEAWDELLYFAHNNPRAIIDFHDYTTGRAWSQQHDRLDTLAARLWKPQPLRWDDERNVHNQWHIGRHAPLVARARRLGLRVRFGVGECVHDHMGDLGAVRKQLNARFGMPEFMGDVRGTRSHYWYYAALSGKANFGWHDLAQMVLEDLAWLDEQYPQEFEYFAVFAYNRNTHWIAYDWSVPEMDHCLQAILTYRSNDMSQPNPPTPPQVEHPEAAALDIVQTVRVREVPGTGGTILGQLAAGIRVSTLANRNTVHNQGYEWLQFEHNGRAGWVALHKTSDLDKPFVRVTWLSDEEEAPEIPEVPPGMTIIDLPHFSFTAPIADLTNAAAYFAAERENPYTPAWLDQLLQVLELAISAEAQRLRKKA